MELWKPVKGFEDFFEVSSLGNFRRKGKEEKLIQHVNKKGYKLVATKPYGRNNGNKTFRVHREVALAFIANPENKPQVNHKDGVKTNNAVENLEWCTAKENVKHAWETGLSIPLLSTQVHNTKVSDEEIKEIYDKYMRGLGSLRSLCREADVSHQTVMRRYKSFNCKGTNNE